MRVLAGLIAVTGLWAPGSCCLAADTWGGSLALTSDYLVRGITRTYDRPALQLDLHALDSSGLVAGFFASNTQIDEDESRGAELNPYLGFAWKSAADWHGKVLASYYAYPWNASGSRYNYVELDADWGYQEWLDLAASYSPDSPRFVQGRGLEGVSEWSAEVNLQQPLFRRLSGTAGVGYADLAGPRGTGYVYWSVGAALDLAPLALAVAYVDTSNAARLLYYDNAATGHFLVTAMWRF
jgi:uncharacterized protein (TIGR02001 family)